MDKAIVTWLVSLWGGVLLPLTGWAAPEPLLQLSQPWQLITAEGTRPVELPYTTTETSALTLRYELSFPDSLFADTLYLYLEGVIWNAQLSLGETYLGSRRSPFGSWVVPIASELLQPCEKYEVNLMLERGESYPWHPKPFLGLLQAPVLLTRSQLIEYQQPIMALSEGDTMVALVAPYYRQFGFQFDSLEAVRSLQPLYKKGIKTLFFPYSPSRKFQEICAALGFAQVLSIGEHQRVSLVNRYPFEPRSFRTQDRFWLDEQGYRTPYYGDAFQMGKRARKEQPSLGLILMVLFPLLSIFLIKLLNPGFFQTQRDILLNPKLHLMSGVDITTSNTGLLGILMLLKSLNLAIFLSLLIHYVSRENQWEQFNLLREWSLLNQWFYGSEGLWQIFRRSLLLVAGWFLLKNLLLLLLGGGYRLKNFVPGIMSLEVFAAFPLILLLSVPLALLLFTQSAWGIGVTTLLTLLVLGYLLRRIYVFYLGLGRLFNFSTAVKILYICALNLLPYLIWF